MSRPICFLVALLIVSPAFVGCEPSKKDSTPNENLQVPEVPAAGHGSKGEMNDPMIKKKK